MNAMQYAFTQAAHNAINKGVQISVSIVQTIVKAKAKPQSGWSANLSYNTAKALNAPMYNFVKQPKMRYDRMVAE